MGARAGPRLGKTERRTTRRPLCCASLYAHNHMGRRLRSLLVPIRRKEDAMKQVDMAVIGTGPAGQKAAIQAAKLGKRVALIERSDVLGGACINTGTIPSKALREAVLQLVRMGQSRFYGEGHSNRPAISIDDL